MAYLRSRLFLHALSETGKAAATALVQGGRADRHSPRSTELRISLSSASRFMIVRLSLQVLLRGPAPWNDRLHRDQPIVFDEWHEVHVIVS
jgi:hypothetical protein